jgi:hypothetical protein
MAKILKATVGILFSERMFRFTSLTGALTDELLALRGRGINADSFQTIGRDPHNSNLNLYNEESGIYLNITIESITYTRDLYDSDSRFEFDNFYSEFQAIWQTVDSILKFPTIRRIGFVTEQRFHTGSTSNKTLLNNLTTLKSNGFPAKFHLTFDDRINVGHGGLPDPTKDDFINIIRTFYDSSIDAQNAEADAINANLDVQRYFTPAHKGKPFDEIKKLKKEYDKAAQSFNNDLTRFGIDNAKTA